MLNDRPLRQQRIIRLMAAGALLLGLCNGPLPGAAAADRDAALQFERDIWPIVAVNCVGCHGADRPKAGLDLRSVSRMLRGGKSGPAVDRADPDSSLLLERIQSAEMPPGKARKLSSREIAAVRSWLVAGAQANDPTGIPPPSPPVHGNHQQFWSLRPLARPPVPDLSHRASVRTPVDSFLLARLESNGLGFSREADAATLVRRAYLDVIGLPPSPTEVDAYLADRAAGAFERLIVRLLASPHFGERWGRHWLDVAGYVDTVGFDTDATNIILAEGKWRYRDYVITALNQDKPYDRFITEQLAGDELFDWRRALRFTPEMREALIATGYLRTARDLTHEDVGVIPQNFFGILHDTIEIVGTGLLGLTVNCARCHDHKFDPIPQEDYYRLMAIFTPAYNPKAWRPVIPTETDSKDRALPDISPAEYATIQRHNAEIVRQVAKLRSRLADLEKRSSDRLIKEQVQRVKAEIKQAEAKRKNCSKIQALYDMGPPPATYLLVRGSELSPGPEVPPGFMRALCESESDAVAKCSPPYPGTSGRRRALARWLTEPGSPACALVARVTANRIWKQFFGQGIVPTPDNFGAQGQAPTHPELLEWLSSELVESGWRIKPLCRLLLSSTAYRQASSQELAAGDSARSPERIDPANDLVWRMRLRRLESEVVRDSILTVSGDRSPSIGGPSVPINTRPDGLVEVAKDRLATPGDGYKRSIYLTARRAYNPSLLSVFDQPLVATNCVRRVTSAVPLQSLFLLNDSFVAEQAGHFARRVERAALSSLDDKIDLAFRLALARHPNEIERKTCRDLVEHQAQRFLESGASQETASHQALDQLCLTLLNTSEFLFAE
jgi:mono/diheme cytochrome c family protein